MPAPLVLKYAQQTKRSVSDVEFEWDKAKEIADNAFKGSPRNSRYWAYVNAIVRKRLKLSEDSLLKEIALLESTQKILSLEF